MLMKPIGAVMMEKYQSMIGSKINNQRMTVRGLKQRIKAVNIQKSLNRMENNGMKCVDPVLKLLYGFHHISKNGRNIYE